MKRIGLLITVLVLALPVVAPAALDCSRAKTNAEKLLCSNPRLAEADERLAFAFRGAVRRGADPEQLMQTQRAWIRDVRDVCNEAECMLRAYEVRISDLDNR
ncbi:MAG: lysozyme inhibitor LprI family protein [Betaproteobacteria bacterium]